MSYPLSGFSKISWEELLGIIETLKLFGSLDEQGKESVMLMMDGLKYRKTHPEPGKLQDGKEG